MLSVSMNVSKFSESAEELVEKLECCQSQGVIHYILSPEKEGLGETRAG